MLTSVGPTLMQASKKEEEDDLITVNKEIRWMIFDVSAENEIKTM